MPRRDPSPSSSAMRPRRATRVRRVSALAAVAFCWAAVLPAAAHTEAETAEAAGAPTAQAVQVSNGNELRTALANALPGQVIQLVDGTYSGNFKINRPGERQNRIILTGSSRAVLTPTSGGGNGLHLDRASHWTIHGITLSGGQKGIMVDASDYVVVDGVTVHDLTMEGIHYRNSSSHGTVKNSTIFDTGQDGRGMGEGVYIGSANTLNDRSDHVKILDNVIGPDVRGENIDIKEGTTGGLISGNFFDGGGLANANYDDSWVDVKGNGYVIENNRGVNTLKDGYQVRSQQPGWGCGTVFRGNHSDLRGAGGSNRYAIQVTNHHPQSCPVTIGAGNTVTGGDGLVNPGVPVG